MLPLLSVLVISALPWKVSSVEVPVTVDFNVSFPTFLSRADMEWSWGGGEGKMPTGWTEGGWVGNGVVGGTVFGNGTHLLFPLARSDVYDDRVGGSNISVGNNFVYDRPRLPIGQVAVEIGEEREVFMRQRLYDGVVEINMTSSDSSWINITFGAHRGTNTSSILFLHFKTSLTTSSSPLNISFIPFPAVSTWHSKNSNYQPNPPPKYSSPIPSSRSLVLQPHLSSSSHAIGLQTNGSTVSPPPQQSSSNPYGPFAPLHHFQVPSHSSSNAETVDFYVSIGRVWTEQEEAVQEVETELNTCGAKADAVEVTKEWWSHFWPQGGFLTMDNSWIESFFFLQVAKMAMNTGENGTVHDLQGTMTAQTDTPWPDLHTDMNIEATYYAPIRTNRISLMGAYVKWMQKSIPNFSKNTPWDDAAAAPTGASSLQGLETCYWDYAQVNNSCVSAPPSITGNLLWMLHPIAQTIFHSPPQQQKQIVTSTLFPLLTKALNAYLHFQIDPQSLREEEEVMRQQGQPQSEGSTSPSASSTIHLPVTFSPEYPYGRGNDTSYDVALYRWGLKTVLQLATAFNLSHPNLPRYASTLSRLTTLPIDPATGIEIAAGVPLNHSHRHYSHLLSIWPLATLPMDTNTTLLNIAMQSVDHWLSLPGALTGFCRPAASSMSLYFGRPSAAVTNVTDLLQNYVHPNTAYTEGTGSCSETPQLASNAIANFFLIEFNRTILLFRGAFDQSNESVRVRRGEGDAGVLESSPPLSSPSFAFLSALTGSPSSLLPTPVLVSSSLNAEGTDVAWVHVMGIGEGEVSLEAPFLGDWSLVSSSPPAPSLMSHSPINLPNPVPLRRLSFTIKQNQNITLFPTSSPPSSLSISPAKGCAADFNYWGGGGGGSGGGGVEIRECGNGSTPDANQELEFVDAGKGNGEGMFRLVAQPSLCLAVSGCSASNDAAVGFVDCDGGGRGCKDVGCGGQNMLWKFSNTTAPNRLTTALGIDQYCLDIPGAEGPNVDIYTCQEGTQHFKNLAFQYLPESKALISLLTRTGWGPGFCVGKKAE